MGAKIGSWHNLLLFAISFQYLVSDLYTHTLLWTTRSGRIWQLSLGTQLWSQTTETFTANNVIRPIALGSSEELRRTKTITTQLSLIAWTPKLLPVEQLNRN